MQTLRSMIPRCDMAPDKAKKRAGCRERSGTVTVPVRHKGDVRDGDFGWRGVYYYEDDYKRPRHRHEGGLRGNDEDTKGL